MASPAILTTILFLRILCLIVLAASAVVMVLNKSTDDIDGTKNNFYDLIAYRYVVGAAAIGFVYTLIQVPFAMYEAIRKKRLIRNGFLENFDFYGDKVIAFILASGVGVGFGVTFELKRAFDAFFSDDDKKFLLMGNISTGLLLVGFVFMALLSIFTSFRHSKVKMFR